jgi:hypothetical protein
VQRLTCGRERAVVPAAAEPDSLCCAAERQVTRTAAESAVRVAQQGRARPATSERRKVPQDAASSGGSGSGTRAWRGCALTSCAAGGAAALIHGVPERRARCGRIAGRGCLPSDLTSECVAWLYRLWAVAAGCKQARSSQENHIYLVIIHIQTRLGTSRYTLL